MTSALVPDLDVLSATLLRRAGEGGQAAYYETEAKASFLPASGPAFIFGSRTGEEGSCSGGRWDQHSARDWKDYKARSSPGMHFFSQQ